MLLYKRRLSVECLNKIRKLGIKCNVENTKNFKILKLWKVIKLTENMIESGENKNKMVNGIKEYLH